MSLDTELLVARFPVKSREAVVQHQRFVEAVAADPKRDAWAELSSMAGGVPPEEVLPRRKRHGDVLPGRLLWALGSAQCEVHELSRSDRRPLALIHADAWLEALRARWDGLLREAPRG